MPSHVHMIIGSKKNKLEDIVRDMKKHTSLELKTTIKNNILESRKEWNYMDDGKSRKEKWQ